MDFGFQFNLSETELPHLFSGCGGKLHLITRVYQLCEVWTSQHGECRVRGVKSVEC